MIEKWGFKLPKQPCDKSFRACYRATSQHCLVQDLSYMRCIEITGAYQNIVSKLAKVTDSKIGLTFSATCFCKGIAITYLKPNIQRYNPFMCFREKIWEPNYF